MIELQPELSSLIKAALISLPILWKTGFRKLRSLRTTDPHANADHLRQTLHFTPWPKSGWVMPTNKQHQGSIQNIHLLSHTPIFLSQPTRHVFLPTTPLANSPNVIPVPPSTTSPKFGCVNTANVFLATLPPPPPFTKCGTARNFPFVISSSASPVWKARLACGMLIFVIEALREWM